MTKYQFKSTRGAAGSSQKKPARKSGITDSRYCAIDSGKVTPWLKLQMALSQEQTMKGWDQFIKEKDSAEIVAAPAEPEAPSINGELTRLTLPKRDAPVESQDDRRKDYFALFLKSREAMGVSNRTLQFYKERLTRIFVNSDYIHFTQEHVQDILKSIPRNKYGYATRHASFRALKTFYLWLNSEYGFPYPMKGVIAPILEEAILPTLTLEQVQELIKKSPNDEARAIIALFVDSGLRLTELSTLKIRDVDLDNKTVRVMGKGRKEADATFGPLTKQYLEYWIVSNRDGANSNVRIWDINASGIVSMLRRLKKVTGITCNAHVFRRTFAVLLRKAGVDIMTIRELGRWKSLEMVKRYTRAFSFQDSVKLYRAPLGQSIEGRCC